MRSELDETREYVALYYSLVFLCLVRYSKDVFGVSPYSIMVETSSLTLS